MLQRLQQRRETSSTICRELLNACAGSGLRRHHQATTAPDEVKPAFDPKKRWNQHSGGQQPRPKTCRKLARTNGGSGQVKCVGAWCVYCCPSCRRPATNFLMPVCHVYPWALACGLLGAPPPLRHKVSRSHASTRVRGYGGMRADQCRMNG